MLVRPCIVLIHNDSILLMKYNYNNHTVYCLPGGNPEGLETLEQCLLRELKEELGLEIRVKSLLAMGEVIFEEQNKSTLHCIFTGEIISGSPKINPEHTKAMASEWKQINEIGSLNMYPNVGMQIKEFLNGATADHYIGKISQPWF